MKLTKLLILLVLSSSILLQTSQQVFANGVSFSDGDVMVSTGSGTVLHYSNTGTLLDTLTGGTGFMTGSIFDASGNFYVTDFSTDIVIKYDSAGNIAANPWASNEAGAHNESILIDQSGKVYIGQPDGSSDIRRLDSSGVFQQAYNAADDNRGTDWIDLDSDQCTMYYTSEGRAIQRYDVCLDSQLTNFATLPGSGDAYAFRLLPAGGLLVADGSNVKQLDSSGSVINTYDISAQSGDWFALNLDPDGTHFWSATTAGQIREFVIGSGGMDSDVAGWSTTTGDAWGLSVKGEITVGGPSGLIGGEILPIDNVALILAGLQLSTIWMAPLLAGTAGATAFYLKTRKN